MTNAEMRWNPRVLSKKASDVNSSLGFGISLGISPLDISHSPERFTRITHADLQSDAKAQSALQKLRGLPPRCGVLPHRKDRLLTRSPLPPNRTSGSPAYGSPVGGFTSWRIERTEHGRLQG